MGNLKFHNVFGIGSIGIGSGLVYGNVVERSIIHLLSCALHKSRRPVNSTSVAGVLEASEAFDELIPSRSALGQIPGICIKA